MFLFQLLLIIKVQPFQLESFLIFIVCFILTDKYFWQQGKVDYQFLTLFFPILVFYSRGHSKGEAGSRNPGVSGSYKTSSSVQSEDCKNQNQALVSENTRFSGGVAVGCIFFGNYSQTHFCIIFAVTSNRSLICCGRRMKATPN